MGFTSFEPTAQPAIFELEQLNSINLSFFPYQDADILLGVSVKLRSDGTVEPAATGEDVIGVVVRKKGQTTKGQVMVMTNFQAVLNAKSEGNLAKGALAKLDAANTVTNGQITVVAVAQGNYANYRVLNTGTDGSDIQVGVLYAPVVKS